jgi:ribosome-binding protein aMBF1 (putative translation factor)
VRVGTIPVDHIGGVYTPSRDYGRGRQCECGQRVNRYSTLPCYRCRRLKRERETVEAIAEAERKAKPRDQRGISLPHLRVVRVGRGISQKRLAPEVGCSYNFISQIERGLHGAGEDVAQRIAEALGVSVSDLKGEGVS